MSAPGRPVRPIPLTWSSSAAVVAVGIVGLFAFLWPFVLPAEAVLAHGSDAPWFFAVLLGLLALVVLAEISAGRLDAKTIAVVAVVAAAGGAMRVLSAGTAGLEALFFVVIVAARVLGRGTGFVCGALAVVVGAFLTGGVGPWLPFQMVAAGWVGLLAACLPPATGRAERILLAAYALVSGLLYGAAMNLWFWPFLGATAPPGAGFVPGDSLAANVQHYLTFYVATSLGWDLPRGILNAVLVLLAGGPVLAVLRRASRRAAFDASPVFEPGEVGPPAVAPGQAVR